MAKEVEVDGQPTPSGKGYVDYVLWDDDGTPLAVIEAKKTSVDPERGLSRRSHADDGHIKLCVCFGRHGSGSCRGFLAKLEDPILNEDGSTSWDVNRFDFIAGDAPDTVNPSLWRQGKLNRIHGLFEVVDGIYQIRGYDLAVMTLIKGETGWIVIDRSQAFL